MKSIATPLSVLLLACATLTAQAADKTRGCAFDIKPRCLSGEAHVTLANGAVTKISVDVASCGLRGRPAYTCTIDASRDEKDATWSQDGGATVIANNAPFNPAAPDKVKVTIGKAVSIDLAETQSLGRCGAGAELPQAIVIPAKKGACRVFLGTH